jgi:predicted MPP superfamily phosphohydrolase
MWDKDGAAYVPASPGDNHLMLLMLQCLVLFGACVGHVAILSYSLNRWYGRPFPRKFLLCVRALHGVLVLAGLAAFAWAFWQERFANLLSLHSGSPWLLALAGYTLVCAVVGCLVVPLLSIVRLWRGQAPVLESNHTRTVDIARDLGYKPVGRGKYRLLASAPGNQVFQVDFAEKTLVLPEMPAAWDGLSILHLSDLHFSDSVEKSFYQRVLDLCSQWEADLVALTGDYVDSEHHHRWLLPVLGRLRWRVAAFAILGNHDLWFDVAMIRRRLRRLGIRMLANSWEQIEVRGEPMVVIGHEGPWLTPAPDLQACPQSGFRLCLSHTPDNMTWARRQGINLVLAGHNHGGQIRFPLIGSVLVPSKYGRRYDCGTFYEAPTVLHVSRGLGGKQPIRIRCRPEITRIVLKRSNRSERIL